MSLQAVKPGAKHTTTMELLRFTTAGSVDDGKSTLIGRLLYDSKSIFEDQMEAVKQSSERKGLQHVDLSLLTDGLRSEREQGITIDVAYRYFATPKRKFIIADTPGHIQYTRNMVTGASTANLALVLIDARKGVVEQTCRHSFIASLLKIPHIIVCVNKMDLVDYSEEAFNKVVEQYEAFAAKIDVTDIRFVPISALAGDNVVNDSENMPWYKGESLLHTLETIHIASDENHSDARFPVQTVIRPHADEYHDYRGYAGRIAGGIFRPGDKITVLPSGLTSAIKSIDTYSGPVEEAFAPMSVSITLEDDIDVSRGDMIVKDDSEPQVSQDLDAMICWMATRSPRPGAKYHLKTTTREVMSIIKEVYYKLDINTLEKQEENTDIKMNEMVKIRLRTTQPVVFDEYRKNRITGSLILVDESTNETVAAGTFL
ncbi:sulfate adenylyltransferase subunit CysN [Mucilaginibacter rubeus]|uniref:sulfate adenylyltransferase n=2 Tax=Mucilaginibacter TaxID=423349 RepID=A0AAE6JAH0_9SPHI|nr:MULTISPECIES: sulfate adenylyltransferase subunit CysN [Mucilaginibacter]QEM02064.1 sulfate adenylyltransferase subunit CysN [Mucilaginibacter rubeus]QEM14689.1 sulfate adenylyltransferase subunit CysN [Mucilaginibacter gossypii]QTE42603.1 sulfate adenylyltransferase subunit CysN [Mucilaginibacter rubeus]QTE49204.1 sulfate adenylyltransferase subunit CysN [Mucilaginibacter rubeus]QTE54301.1 sulfate adenylyltransferase subunit CysN [Mucilaginibacter rubeus]